MKSTDDVARKRAQLERCSTGHSERDVALSALGEALHERFRKVCELDDLKEATELTPDALGVRQPGNKRQSLSLGELAICLSDEYANRRVVTDLEDSMVLGCTASELRPLGHLDRGPSHHNPPCNFRTRFRKQVDMRDLEEAIELHHAALDLRPSGHPDRFSSLRNFAFCLLDRYDNQGLVANFTEAAVLNNASRMPYPAGLPDRDTFFRSLACDLATRLKKPADMRSLEEAIELHRAALELRPPGHPRWFSSFQKLSRCLLARYGNTGAVADLKDVVRLGRAALEFYPPGHPDYGTFLHDLACTLRTRFKKQTDIRDLQEAIELHRLALELRPPGHPGRSSSLQNLAVCFSDKYDNAGLVADLAEAVTLGRAALELRPPGHPNRDISLHDLACNLRMRFEKQVTMEDLEEAILLHRAALELRLSGHPLRFSSLQNLALCLSDRYDNLRVVADSPEPTTSDRIARAVHPPEHPDRGTADLDEAIALEREALRLLVPGDRHYDICRQRLTARLQMKAKLQVATPSPKASSPRALLPQLSPPSRIWTDRSLPLTPFASLGISGPLGECEDDRDVPLQRNRDVHTWLAANKLSTAPNAHGSDDVVDLESRSDGNASEQTAFSGSHTADISIEESDIVVVVMGPTGSGKSIARTPDIRAGHDLTSCTKEVRAVRYPHTDGDRNIVLVDTPGFDDTFMTDAEVLQRTADWLKSTCEKNMKPSGVLYLHRISDNRVGGAPLRNYRMFKELCRKDNFKNVILVTTMWDAVTEEVGAAREQELHADFWKAMIALGSTTHRFEGTTESAWEIINSLSVPSLAPRRPLQIQLEMVDAHIPLHRTAATRTVQNRLNGQIFRWFSRGRERSPRPTPQHSSSPLRRSSSLRSTSSTYTSDSSIFGTGTISTSISHASD